MGFFVGATLLIVFAANAGMAAAPIEETGSLAVLVEEDTTGDGNPDAPVVGVFVTLMSISLAFADKTDSNGQVFFTDIPTGMYKLNVNAGACKVLLSGEQNIMITPSALAKILQMVPEDCSCIVCPENAIATCNGEFKCACPETEECTPAPLIPFLKDSDECSNILVGDKCRRWKCDGNLKAFGKPECTSRGWDVGDAYCGCENAPYIYDAYDTRECVGTPVGEACHFWVCPYGLFPAGSAFCTASGEWVVDSARCTRQYSSFEYYGPQYGNGYNQQAYGGSSYQQQHRGYQQTPNRHQYNRNSQNHFSHHPQWM